MAVSCRARSGVREEEPREESHAKAQRRGGGERGRGSANYAEGRGGGKRGRGSADFRRLTQKGVSRFFSRKDAKGECLTALRDPILKSV